MVLTSEQSTITSADDYLCNVPILNSSGQSNTAFFGKSLTSFTGI